MPDFEVWFTDSFKCSAEKFFTADDCTELALHLRRCPDDGFASRVSDRLRILPWRVTPEGASEAKDVLVWFVAVPEKNELFVVGLDTECPSDDGDDENSDRSAADRMDQIELWIYRAQDWAEKLRDLWDQFPGAGV